MIFVVDDLTPEDIAMLQALYSRSAESVQVHLDKIYQARTRAMMAALMDHDPAGATWGHDLKNVLDAAFVTSDKAIAFNKNYVVGYTHKSIADCGTTTIFIEGVSLLAAKAIQDNPLYSGQETSTRYIDMSKQPIVDPIGTDRSKAILDRWMKFYTSNQERVSNTVRERFPRRPDEDQKKYDGAVRARTFDILRGFLPAGIQTQLSWHTNLRQAGDHLTRLQYHPSSEIRGIANEIKTQLQAKYPGSGFDRNLATVSGVADTDDAQKARDKWERQVMESFAYSSVETHEEECAMSSTLINLEAYAGLIQERPRGSVLPHWLSDLGQLWFAFKLDFGSFRDLQRHRNGVCRMPLLTMEHGFEPWYLAQLDEDLRIEANKLLIEQMEAISDITDNEFLRQYYTALGFRVQCSVTYALPAAVYVMEMRSAKTVHPTLRKAVHKMVLAVREFHPSLKMYIDADMDDWTIRRGGQTITEKA